MRPFPGEEPRLTKLLLPRVVVAHVCKSRLFLAIFHLCSPLSLSLLLPSSFCLCLRVLRFVERNSASLLTRQRINASLHVQFLLSFFWPTLSLNNASTCPAFSRPTRQEPTTRCFLFVCLRKSLLHPIARRRTHVCR